MWNPLDIFKPKLPEGLSNWLYKLYANPKGYFEQKPCEKCGFVPPCECREWME
jgi:myosin-crossreactive antigen